METRQLKRMAFQRFAGGAVVLGAVFFLSAGTIRYWQAWLYMAVTFIPMALVARNLIRTDPALVERRLKAREERAAQSTVQKLGAVIWIATFLVPGLDQRFGWSSVPWSVVLLSNLLVLSGYLFLVRVLRENSYASRVVEVQKGQTVISTGPYALVRHPMYLAVLIMLGFSPLALGSYWALVPAVLTPVFLVLRIQDEENMLLEELPAYREYTNRTRHKLIPGVW